MGEGLSVPLRVSWVVRVTIDRQQVCESGPQTARHCQGSRPGWAAD